MFVFGREVRILKRMRECAIEMKFDVKTSSSVDCTWGYLSRVITGILFDKEM